MYLPLVGKSSFDKIYDIFEKNLRQSKGALAVSVLLTAIWVKTGRKSEDAPALKGTLIDYCT